LSIKVKENILLEARSMSEEEGDKEEEDWTIPGEPDNPENEP
jgi:hypothetical protein